MAGYGTIAITTVGGVTNYIDNQGGQFNTINSDAQIAAAGANLLATVNPLLATTALNLSLGAMSTSIAAFAIDVKAGNNLNAVGDIFTAIGDAIGAAADVVAIVPGGGAIAAELDVAGDVATGAGVALIHSGDITTAIKEMATEISQGTFPAFEYLNGQIDNAKASISSALSATEKSLSEDFNFLSDAIKDVDTSAFTTIANTASNSLYSIDDTITSLFDATGDTTSKITDVTTGSSYSVTDVDSSTVLVSGASIISVDASSIGVTAVDADTKLSENANVGEDISETVDEANGTSQVTTYNADGSTVTDSYSGANGTGTLTSKDVEDLNGTSQITTYGADGSSVTSFYAGPNGTGTDFGQDVENSDGTSQWTVNFPDGSSVSSNYSGPKATGSVTSTTSVTGISADQSQTIVIHGSGFGTQAAYTGDSDDILFTDETRGWNAGYSLNDPSDFVTLSVESWTDSKIVLGGFAGDWGEDDWILNVGDTVEISVWNPQTGKLAGSVSASVTSGVSTSANDLDLKGTTNPDGSTITAVDGSGTSLSGTVTNDGNVIIDSIGDETDITAVGNTTLAGTGTVQMSNSAQNFIQGPIEPGARLTIATGQTIKPKNSISVFLSG